MHITYESIFSKIAVAKAFGYKETKYARLYGHVPHVAPEAWFHEVYKAASAKERLTLERKLPALPAAYKIFLKAANGLLVFSDTIALYGIRHDYGRSGDDAYQPYDLLELNDPVELPPDSSDDCFIVGRYSGDGSKLYMRGGPEVWRCRPTSVRPLNEWPSLEVMLFEEVSRLSAQFDAEGHLIGKTSQLNPKKMPSLGSGQWKK